MTESSDPRTVTESLAESSQPGAVWGRRIGLVLLAGMVAAALAGLLGVRTGETSATGSGYTLVLRYPALARAGLDVRWQVRVEHPGGFDGPVTLALTGDYLDVFETQGFHPEPSDETRTAHVLLLSFAPPPGDTFVVDYDAYIQPASQWGRTARLELIRDGRPVTGVDFRTWLWP